LFALPVVAQQAADTAGELLGNCELPGTIVSDVPPSSPKVTSGGGERERETERERR
jgi:hypothetical protein